MSSYEAATACDGRGGQRGSHCDMVRGCRIVYPILELRRTLYPKRVSWSHKVVLDNWVSKGYLSFSA